MMETIKENELYKVKWEKNAQIIETMYWAENDSRAIAKLEYIPKDKIKEIGHIGRMIPSVRDKKGREIETKKLNYFKQVRKLDFVVPWETDEETEALKRFEIEHGIY